MPPPSNRRPFPDKAHEDLAKWVEETIADLRANQADIADSFLLVDTLFSLTDEARTAIGTGQGDVGDSLLLVDVLFTLLDAATAQIADLTGRVAALEPAVFQTEPDAT